MIPIAPLLTGNGEPKKDEKIVEVLEYSTSTITTEVLPSITANSWRRLLSWENEELKGGLNICS